MADRHVAVALDYSPSSKYAVSWALENIIRQGDHLLLLVVQKQSDEDGQSNLWGETGSPLVSLNDLKDPGTSRKYGLANDRAFLDELEASTRAKQLTVNLKVYYGDARMKITHAVLEHSIDALVMGNRGQSGIRRMLLGSVSNYLVNNVPCPVTVVKLPEA